MEHSRYPLQVHLIVQKAIDEQRLEGVHLMYGAQIHIGPEMISALTTPHSLVKLNECNLMEGGYLPSSVGANHTVVVFPKNEQDANKIRNASVEIEERGPSSMNANAAGTIHCYDEFNEIKVDYVQSHYKAGGALSKSFVSQMTKKWRAEGFRILIDHAKKIRKDIIIPKTDERLGRLLENKEFKSTLHELAEHSNCELVETNDELKIKTSSRVSKIIARLGF